MALNVLEKSLNLTLPHMYEPWYKLSSGGGGVGGGGTSPDEGPSLEVSNSSLIDLVFFR